MSSSILPITLALPRPTHRPFSSLAALTADRRLHLSVGRLSLPLTAPRCPPIRMGGGPRTFPGGVSKWQWKRMQAKKAKQLLKARLLRERQIYEMRKRAELKSAVSELERPWEAVPERAPALFSVRADEQVKALADRFQRPGGFDMWSDRDGPQVFRAPDGLPSARFFPKGAVHSLKPYVSDGNEGPEERYDDWIARGGGGARRRRTRKLSSGSDADVPVDGSDRRIEQDMHGRHLMVGRHEDGNANVGHFGSPRGNGGDGSRLRDGSRDTSANMVGRSRNGSGGGRMLPARKVSLRPTSDFYSEDGGPRDIGVNGKRDVDGWALAARKVSPRPTAGLHYDDGVSGESGGNGRSNGGRRMLASRKVLPRRTTDLYSEDGGSRDNRGNGRRRGLHVGPFGSSSRSREEVNGKMAGRSRNDSGMTAGKVLPRPRALFSGDAGIRMEKSEWRRGNGLRADRRGGP